MQMQASQLCRMEPSEVKHAHYVDAATSLVKVHQRRDLALPPEANVLFASSKALFMKILFSQDGETARSYDLARIHLFVSAPKAVSVLGWTTGSYRRGCRRNDGEKRPCKQLASNKQW